MGDWYFKNYDKKDQMIQSLKQRVVGKGIHVISIRKWSGKKTTRKIMCDAICDTSYLLQKLDSSCDTNNLV